VDLGYAPGSWSQVAINRTQPGGRVIGIDIIPAQPPRGVSTIQGDFLSEEVREEVRRFVQDPLRGRARAKGQLSRSDDDGPGIGLTEEELEEESKGLMERERELDEEAAYEALDLDRREKEGLSQKELDAAEGRVVNVVLSDMSEPWPLTASTWIKSVSNPYHRMMNTSGMAFRDHAGSMVCSNPPASHLW
jgi:21S rRNA (uridine2791-2'-O)-methyltransferase